jgi:hypothetical protein
MTRPNPLPSSQDESITTAAKHLPPGAEITAHVQCGHRLVIAVEGADAPFGWFNRSDTEPSWYIVLPHGVHGRPYPIKALLSLDDDLVVISDEAIWKYRWAENGGGPDLIQWAQIPRVVGRNLAAAGITLSHLALLTHHICDTQSTSDTIKAMIKGGKLRRRLTETLLLLDSSTFQELGSAAIEQTWDPLVQEEPPHRWFGIELSRGHLLVHQGEQGTVQISLRKGPVIDLQAQLVGCSLNI